MFFNGGDYAPPLRGYLAMPEDIFLLLQFVGVATGIYWVEALDAAIL